MLVRGCFDQWGGYYQTQVTLDSRQVESNWKEWGMFRQENGPSISTSDLPFAIHWLVIFCSPVIPIVNTQETKAGIRVYYQPECELLV
jgi:hypothetical protein